MQTERTDDDVTNLLAAVPDPQRRADATRVTDLMARITGEPPVLWGASIIGFGSRRLRYASGRELDWMLVGVSPRKAATVLYLMDGYEERTELLSRLGPHSIGKSCLYLKKLEAVDLNVLEQLITESVQVARAGQ